MASASQSCALEELSISLPKIRVPSLGDNVHKEECCLSFDNQDSKFGLYICLTTFLAFSRNFVELYYKATHNRIFLHLQRIKKQASLKQKESPSEKKPKRLAIGIEGGFDPDENSQVEYEELKKLVILPEFSEVSLDDIDKIPSLVLASVSGVLSSTGALTKEEVLAWDGEKRPVTKHAHSLLQLDNGIKIPPSGWKCARCDLTNNLWLNLTDGTILCGRRYFDGTGGNNHALDHFKETNYPLAVKLGTITPSGADVYSYDEDTMVDDPCLAKHLSHFGINMMDMQKTEQTMTELEIELNEKLGSEWNIIQESGKKLKELHGAGLVGLKNMGNSCYLNSTLQVLFSIPEFLQRYSAKTRCLELFHQRLIPLHWDPCNPTSSLTKYSECPDHNSAMVSTEIQKRVADFSSDFNVQMCKVGLALNCAAGNASNDVNEFLPVTPRSFKQIVGKGHQEFSTNHQQDAHEYFLHLLSVIERADRKEGVSSIGDCFKFMVEERIECLQSKQVRYTKRCEYALTLPVPLERATNKCAVDAYNKAKEAHQKDPSVQLGDVVRAVIPFQACIAEFAEDEPVIDFWSSALKEKSEARRRTRLATFPDYLVIQLRKFTVGSDWVPKKLDVSVSMPDQLDLNQYRGRGLQKDEVVLPDINPPTEKPPVEIDENAVLAISQMGFPVDRCRDAIIATGNCGAEPAIMWLMENPDAEIPVGHPSPPEPNVTSLMEMGFTREQSMKALRATNNDLERAADWIFSHLDELDTIDPAMSVAGEGDVAMETGPTGTVSDGPGNYEMIAFISHMGTSTMCGHYVCHIKKQGRWVIFNDEKVAESETPPKDLGYIYFYRRLSE